MPSVFSAASCAVAFALAAGLLGCAHTTQEHHVKSARARLLPPLLPALNPSEGEARHLLTLHASRVESDGRPITVREDVHDPDDGYDSYYASPGDYTIERDRLSLGAEFQLAPMRYFDLFLALEATPDKTPRTALASGLGVTLPLPWLSVRAAPAVGLQTLQLNAVDSIYQTSTPWYSGEIRDTSWIDTYDAPSKIAPFMAVSVSAWVPRSITRSPLKPFAQFQWTRVGVFSSTLPTEVLGLDVLAFGGGVDLEGPLGNLRARVMRESVHARGSQAALRGELGLALRLPE